MLAVAAPVIQAGAVVSIDQIKPRAPLWLPGWFITVLILTPGVLLASYCWWRVLRRRHGNAYAWAICLAFGLLHAIGGSVALGLLVLMVRAGWRAILRALA
jgi:hypothetical protein